MKLHVLDTSAIYLLEKKESRCSLWNLLIDAPEDETVLIPSIVVVEANQVRPIQKKRWKNILELLPERATTPIDARLAMFAAELLQKTTRQKCDKCSDLGRPSLVDALVMAVAACYGEGGRSIVHTADIDDMNKLRDASEYLRDVVVSDVNNPSS